MSNYEKDLIGSSIPLMETDTEPSLVNNSLIYNAETNADNNDVIENFGKEGFKEIYLNNSNEIQLMSIDNQRDLCEKLSEKIYEMYSFEFSPKLDFDNNGIITEFFKFIEFLEFDYIDVLSIILEGGDFDFLKKDPEGFINKYWVEINNKIEKENFSELISKFLRTNNKDNIISFIISRIEKDKMLVILRILERGILK